MAKSGGKDGSRSSIMIILGTRPEIVKMSPVIRECERRRLRYCVLHTGQHYSYAMDKSFFDQLELPTCRYNLEVGSGSHAEQTAKILVGVEKILREQLPGIVLVEGDTNSVLAGALAAAKLHIQVGHVEAGLRSYDRTMPEEINRILTDHCADYLFAPTEQSKAILKGEGISEDRIFVTGNTIVDAVFQNIEIAKAHASILGSLHLEPQQYFLVTLHRQENVDDPVRFSSILASLRHLIEDFGFPVIYPIHPRSRRRLEEFRLETGKITLIDPVDFMSFLQLESNAKVVLTDSGGVQEESCILRVPCVTLRDNTERPETIEVGANILAGTTSTRIVQCVERMLRSERSWPNPFGDGTAGEKIVNILLEDNYG